MKLVLNPSHRELESFMLGLPEQFSSLGECIYKARNELRRFTYEGKSYVVKGYKVPLLINRIAYTFFRPGKRIAHSLQTLRRIDRRTLVPF